MHPDDIPKAPFGIFEFLRFHFGLHLQDHVAIAGPDSWTPRSNDTPRPAFTGSLALTSWFLSLNAFVHTQAGQRWRQSLGEEEERKVKAVFDNLADGLSISPNQT